MVFISKLIQEKKIRINLIRIEIQNMLMEKELSLLD